ncbi:DNA-binding protein [Ralstonia pseudosolanacearum]|uniref:DNA-binding protein n=1 Tax=Ralstonia pseudosolanacearum TaxID=1310165 RepID=UPI00270F50E3|nr:DNA-binding protein [Ralstonia pseudosolanacearum]MDO3615318.1 DNA-binding protein [Ralstonia pseudosolanacearum]
MTPYPVSAAEDHQLQADIAALRGRFSDTRELYREVCALLFFRYGVTPTANKLYSLVRKGSMSTPTDVLSRFWQDLRDKTRVKIDHPDLPDPIKQVAADAVLTIWQAASAAATTELAALRAEARHQAHAAETARDQATAESEAARQAAAATQAQLEAARAQLADLQDALAAERQAHAATDARLQEARRQLDEVARQLTDARAEFSAQLDRERERADAADARAASQEKRALREIDQERVARQKSDKLADELRAQVVATRTEMQDRAVEHANAIGTLRAELGTAQQQVETSTAQQRQAADELARMQTQLQDALRRAERAETEAETIRKLVDELKKSTAGRAGQRTRAG